MPVHTIRNMIGALASSKSDVKAQHFSGPVGIMKVYYQLFRCRAGLAAGDCLQRLLQREPRLVEYAAIPSAGWRAYHSRRRGSRRRRPVNTRVLEILQTACAVALISFMLYVTFFDVGDFFTGGKKKAEPTPAPQEQTTEAPKSQLTPRP